MGHKKINTINKIEDLVAIDQLSRKLLMKFKKYLIQDEFPDKVLSEVKKLEVQEYIDPDEGGRTIQSKPSDFPPSIDDLSKLVIETLKSN